MLTLSPLYHCEQAVDLYSGATLGTFNSNITLPVESHDVRVMKLSPV